MHTPFPPSPLEQIFPFQAQNRLDEEIIGVDDGPVGIFPGGIVVEVGPAGEDGIPLGVPVGEFCLAGPEDAVSRLRVKPGLAFPHVSGDLQQAAGGDHGGCGIVLHRLGWLAVVHQGDPVRDSHVGDAVVGALFGGVQEGLFPGVAEAQSEAVHRPGLAPAPGGALPIALSGGIVKILAGVRVQGHNVVAAPIGPDDIPLDGFGVADGDLAEPGVVQLPGRPVQQGQVHHAVDNHPAPDIAAAHPLAMLGLPGAGPGAEEFPLQIVPRGQLRRRQQAPALCLLVPGLAVVGHGGLEEQKAQVVADGLRVLQHRLQALLHPRGGVPVGRVAGGVVHLPQHPRPEAVGPVGQGDAAVRRSPVGRVNDVAVPPVLPGGVRDISPHAAALRLQLDLQLVIHAVQPFLVGTVRRPLSHGKVLPLIDDAAALSPRGRPCRQERRPLRPGAETPRSGMGKMGVRLSEPGLCVRL